MKTDNFAQFDLNLLFAFEAIYLERHVTRAARRLNLGQPALSHSLARLRAIFGDELFVRHAGGVQPTPKAMALIDPITETLASLRRLVEPNRRFEPKTDHRTFRIVISDDLEMSIVPPLAAELAKTSPNLRIETVAASTGEELELIDLAKVDIAVGIFLDGGLQHKRRVICELEPYAVLHDRDQTGLHGPISLEDYARFAHVVVDSRQVLNGRIDQALGGLGHQRSVAITTTHALAVPFMLKQSPLIATMPRRTALTLAPYFDLSLSPLPFAFPSEAIVMIWHDSQSGDPGNKWLRDMVETVAERIQETDSAVLSGQYTNQARVF